MKKQFLSITSASLLLSFSLFSMDHQRMCISNQSGSSLTIRYKRTDPGFLGSHKIITDTVILGKHEYTDISVIKTRVTHLHGIYAIVHLMTPHEKKIFIPTDTENPSVIFYDNNEKITPYNQMRH